MSQQTPTIGELRDETWRAKHRPDSLFGSAVVEDGMRCYVLLGEGDGGRGLRIGVREMTMNHALLQVVREMVMNCTDLLQRDPDFRKVSVSFDAATGGITVHNDGRGIPVGKGLIQLHGENAARLADLWSPTLLLARWGCSSNYDDDQVRFTAGKNGLGAKAVLAWCRRVELRAVDSVRNLSFEQHWEDGMRVESAPKVKVSARKGGFTEIKLWPDYERLVRLPLPLTEEQVGALRWCVWECASILPKGDRFGVSIDGCVLPDHTTEGMMRAVMALCAEASSHGAAALLSATAPLKMTRGKGSGVPADDEAAAAAAAAAGDGASEASGSEAGRRAAAAPPLFRAHVSWPPHNETLTGFAFPTHTFAPGIAAQLPPLGFVNGVPCPRGTHRQRWESAMTTDLGKALGASSAGMTKGTYMQHFFLAASARINQPRFGSQTKDELVTRLPAAATLSGSALPRTALARCGLLAHFKHLSAQRAEAEALKAASEQLRGGQRSGASSGSGPASSSSSSRRRYDVDDVDHYEGAELAGRHADCYLFLTEGLSAQNCARNVIARLDPELKRRCGSFALRGKLINAMVQPAAKVLANKEVQGLLRICNLNPTQRYETAAQRATLRYAKLMLWTDADTDGGHIAWLVFLLVFKFWPELAARGYVERFVTPLLKVTGGAAGAGGAGSALQFYSEVARDRWLEGLAAGGARELHTAAAASAPSDPLLTADMRRRALDEAVVSRGCRMKYYKGLGRLMAEDEKDLAARFDRLRIRLVAEDERDLAMVRALGDEISARREIQTTRSIRALPYDDVEQVSVSDFVDGELLAYMRDANLRQIPAVDGFVEVQRMIVAYFYVTRESAADSADGQVVARLAAAIAAKMDYHHGETSMAGAIATMAQDFAGKNNLNLLRPMGQFGERSEPTPGQPRYTCTALEPYVRTLFPEADYAALPRPRHGEVPVVMPGVIPLLLVNGASGIGYGHSTEIPPHDPRRILRACRDWLEVAPATGPTFSRLDDVTAWTGPEEPPLEFARRCADVLPWVRGLSRQPELEHGTEGAAAAADEADDNGTEGGAEVFAPEPQAEGAPRNVLSWGRAEISADMRSLRVTELPAGVWTKNARAALAKVRWLDSVYMHPRITSVLITADIPDPSLVPSEVRAEVQAGILSDGPQLLRALKLVRRIPYSNMKAFDRTGVALKTFPDVAAILHEFAILRLWVYERRKVLELRRLREEEGHLFGRRRFVELQVAGELDLRAFPNRRAVHEHLELHHPSIPKGPAAPYAYLNGVDVWQLTREEVARLVEKHAAVCRERAALEAMTAADLWRRDLDAVERALGTQWRSEAQPEAQGEQGGGRAAAAGGKAAGKKRARG